MNIHHYHMKQISRHMEQWVQSNLYSLGIFECNFVYTDVNESTWIGIPTSYDWYCHFMHLGLETSFLSRVKKGSHYLDNSSLLYKKYNHFLNTKSSQKLYRYEYISKVMTGYETMSISSNKLLSASNHQYLKQISKIFSKQIQLMKHHNSHISSEFYYPTELQALFYSKPS